MLAGPRQENALGMRAISKTIAISAYLYWASAKKACKNQNQQAHTATFLILIYALPGQFCGQLCARLLSQQLLAGRAEGVV